MNGKLLVTKCMTTETAHRLCNYTGKCAHIHGHSYRWEVTAALSNDSISKYNSISVDFGELKDAMRKIIYARFDHALVLFREDPLYGSSDGMMRFATDDSNQKIVWLDRNPTAEVFAEDTAKHLQEYFRKMECGEEPGLANADEAQSTWVDILRVRVWETADSYGQWEGRRKTK